MYVSSPRPWGCFRRGILWTVYDGVFPTPVGVFLLHQLVNPLPDRLPHARGGVSRGKPKADRVEMSSPRPWGCFSGCAR